MRRYEHIARAIVATMQARDDAAQKVTGPSGRSDRCDRCGTGEEELFWMISPSGGLVHVCDVCGDLCRCTLTPPCAGTPQVCGAAAGKPCAPGCPSRAPDPSVPDAGPDDPAVIG